ncbi:MAG: LemA family protein [Armatimonadota bacterium]|nr:LemA family protein [Armatimonadota bacterium]MCX7777172.1 LemA family protein [Armatimonadota bacterium]MDW8024999.1 LemA family protein [Armatimonadota bacterium]
MTIALVGILFLLVFWVVFVYNRLVRLSMLVNNAWSDVEVQLKRRHDLIPNIIEAVKGYMSYERATLENVVRVRSQAASSSTPDQRAQAEGLLTAALRQLFALAEAYPDLKANQSFLDLQAQLSEVEEQIQLARRYYNAVVRDYNTATRVFPSNIVAALLGFKERPFFELPDEREREVPQVRF